MVIMNLGKEGGQKMGIGKYELGRTLGEGNFGKVKFARNTDSGQPFAVKILDKNKIINLNTTDQIKREIATLKLLRHPNVVRLHEEDGLLHTTCGSPNYVAPEILANKGYDGATSDAWACGVMLYVILTGHLPFDDRNLAVLYQKIFKGDVQIPKWLSCGAQNMINRILDPNPKTRITMAEIKEDTWFKEDYTPTNPYEDEDEENIDIDNEALSIHEVPHEGEERSPRSSTLINAFQLIGMSSSLDLSNFFEKEDVSERKIRFTSNLSAKDLIERIEDIVTEMGFSVQNKNGKVFEISPSLYVVELRKSYGDASVYRQLCKRLSNDLGVPSSQTLISSGSEVN
ncbi:hypothetical protein TanjilG_13546 [Lupinus angustifolius]|uniref:non-specific serine/threonine protein kinase n=1 Tax=Lupinus angustifolius TaxID=3871 RepID=A0A4P1RVV3_LUPAN|nr:hypothetical protein TanjilG_13546 [Lupinus angustifolius]